MKQGAGKAKGGAWEREVSKKLSLWLSEGKQDDLLWRSAMSGGRATVAHKKGKKDSQVGDIAGTSELGVKFTDIFAIECKTYQSLHMESFIYNQDKGALGFWKEIDAKAHASGKVPVLVAKQVRQKPLIIFPWGWGVGHILKFLPGQNNQQAWVEWFPSTVIIQSPKGFGTILIVDFEEFLEKAVPFKAA